MGGTRCTRTCPAVCARRSRRPHARGPSGVVAMVVEATVEVEVVEVVGLLNVEALGTWARARAREGKGRRLT